MTANQYRKRPVVIEAMQWDGTVRSFEEIEDWADQHDTLGDGIIFLCTVGDGHELEISTLEGNMVARDGDWIIKGVKNEFYPCKPDIFEATYEPVNFDQLVRETARLRSADASR